MKTVFILIFPALLVLISCGSGNNLCNEELVVMKDDPFGYQLVNVDKYGVVDTLSELEKGDIVKCKGIIRSGDNTFYIIDYIIDDNKYYVKESDFIIASLSHPTKFMVDAKYEKTAWLRAIEYITSHSVKPLNIVTDFLILTEKPKYYENNYIGYKVKKIPIDDKFLIHVSVMKPNGEFDDECREAHRLAYYMNNFKRDNYEELKKEMK